MKLPDDDTGAGLRRIAADGSDLTRSMKMDFFVAVPDEKSGHFVGRDAEALGFSTSVEQDRSTGKWTCYCTKRIVPSYATVAEIEHKLDEIGRRHGGFADGFGSFGNADEISN